MRFYSHKCFMRCRGESSLEVRVRKALTELGLVFEAQYPVSRYRLDFYLPQYNIAVEADGLYWHDDETDARRDAFLLQRGIVTVRIKEPELEQTPDTAALVRDKLTPFLPKLYIPTTLVRLNIYGDHCIVPALLVFDDLGPFVDAAVARGLTQEKAYAPPDG